MNKKHIRGRGSVASLKALVAGDAAQLERFRCESARMLREAAMDIHLEIGQKLEKAETLISTIASQTGRAQGAAPDRRPQCPRELRQLVREASQPTSCPDERRRLRSEARELRR